MTKYKIKSISGKTIAMKEESTKAFCRYCGDEIMCRCNYHDKDYDVCLRRIIVLEPLDDNKEEVYHERCYNRMPKTEIVMTDNKGNEVTVNVHSKTCPLCEREVKENEPVFLDTYNHLLCHDPCQRNIKDHHRKRTG
jgi:predicted RNA-binding Zn-ribbon protein involved in translation (DUF1610 family)